MTTSTTKPTTASWVSDILTVSRAAAAPLIMALIVLKWPDIGWALIATIVFALAVLTDIFDDLIGGKDTGSSRVFGWFDDIADALLTMSALFALAWVLYAGTGLTLLFVIPVAVLTVCFFIAGVMRTKLLDSGGGRLADISGAVAQLGTGLMIASPWAGNWVSNLTGMGEYGFTPIVWQIGVGVLCLAAVMSLVSLFRLLKAHSE